MGRGKSEDNSFLVSSSFQEERVCLQHGLTIFSFTTRANGNKKPYCLQCNRESVTIRRADLKALLVKESGGKCANCGYKKNINALEFHHLDVKTKSFTLSRRNLNKSLALLREEAKKCKLLCGNCHAEEEAATGYPGQLSKIKGEEKYVSTCNKHGLCGHFKLKLNGKLACKRCRYEAVAKRRRLVKEILVKECGSCCKECGYKKSIAALAFHHVDPSKKEIVISGSRVLGIDKLRQEIKKCILLCRNCHIELHSEVS
jgi:hypothetical protein